MLLLLAMMVASNGSDDDDSAVNTFITKGEYSCLMAGSVAQIFETYKT